MGTTLAEQEKKIKIKSSRLSMIFQRAML